MLSAWPQAYRRLLLRMKYQGTSIILRWVTLTGVTVDVTTGAKLGVATAQSQTIKGFVHFIDEARTQIRLFQEIETGDVIIDIPPDTVIEGREQLAFEIDGQRYAQKLVGEKLAQHWEIQAGQRLYRSLLLRKET